MRRWFSIVLLGLGALAASGLHTSVAATDACDNCIYLAAEFIDAGMDPMEAVEWLQLCLEVWDYCGVGAE